MDKTDFWTLWEKARAGCSERTALKQVYYQGWNRPPSQVGCMRQVPRAGALERPRGMGWGGRWEGGSGWGTHVNPWLIHVNAWQKPLQFCKVISLQLIKINGKKEKKTLVPLDSSRSFIVYLLSNSQHFLFIFPCEYWGFHCGSAGKECLLYRRPVFDPWVGKSPWRRERLPTPVFWPWEFHGLYNPWDLKECDY